MEITGTVALVTGANRGLGAAFCSDVTLLINNAGILTGAGAFSDDAVDAARREFETNVFGTLAVTRAFAPVLGANGGGAMINVLSVLSWLSNPGAALYCASKAAAWSLTNAVRQELQSQNTQVLALHVGLMETDMAARLRGSKSSPDDVAAQALAGMRAGAFEVLADETSRRVRSALSADLTVLYPALASKVSA